MKQRSKYLFAVLCTVVCGTYGAVAHAQVAETLVWSDEFSGPSAAPNPANWTYDVGGGGWYNQELETYCAPTTDKPPCTPAQPNEVVAGGYLHVTARRNGAGEWTSARMISKGLQSFQYGRIEARIRIPAAAPGVWPAFWMMGDDSSTNYWPKCGEIDIMENVGQEPGTIHGSLHGVGINTGKPVQLASGQPFSAAFHTYGMIWSPGKIQFYVDDPAHPYGTFTRAEMPAGAAWPFDQGRFYFLLNFAIGGVWPGNPTAATPGSSEMLVDYVRVYQADRP